MPRTTENTAPSKSNQKKIVLGLAAALVAVSFAAPFFRKAAPTHPITAAGVRLVIACLVMSPLAVRSWLKGRITAHQARLACIAGVFYGLHFGSWVSSLYLTTVAASVTLVTSTPIWLGLAALILGKDRPTSQHWRAIFISLTGVAIISGSDWILSAEALWGDALAVLGAIAMAGYLLIARSLGTQLDLWGFSTIATAVGGITLLSTGAAFGISPIPPSLEAIGFIALAALIPQLVGHNLFTWVVRYTRPTTVGITALGEPVGASILAWLWLNETISAMTALGCAVTLLGLLSVIKQPTSSHTQS